MNWIKKTFSNNSVPIALLAAHLLAFGLFLPYLGYYQDDWHFIYYSYSRGARGLVELFNFDGHPLEVWYYILAFRILGYKPLVWHITSLVWRWLTAVAFWMTLRQLWPSRTKEIFSIALLFSIYPLFSLQAQAISYVGVWFSYFLLCLTFYLTLKAIKTPGKFWLYAIPAILLKVLQLSASEYFAGLELIRPFLIWLALRSEPKTNRQKLWSAVKIWAPYLVLSLIFIAWRVFIFRPPTVGHNDALVVKELFASPLGTMRYVLLHGIPDMVQILFTSWAGVFSPVYFELSSFVSVAIFATMTLGLILALYYQSRLKGDDPDAGEGEWTRQALVLGLIAIALGMLPAYAAGYFITTENYPWNSRFGMAATFGASMVIVSLINLLVASPRHRTAVISVLFALSLAWHADIANGFRMGWQRQVRFFEELAWRAPAIKPHTAIITETEVLPIMGDYPMAFAINAIYARPNVADGDAPSYWYFPMSGSMYKNLDEFKVGWLPRARKFSLYFIAESPENILLSYEKDLGQCLRVVRPEDVQMDFISDVEKSVAHLSTPERIYANAPDDTLVWVIFGERSTRTWCYYFEKADLARQYNDWNQIVSLWKEASQAGLTPNTAYEYFPFIEAYGQTGDWNSAVKLTQASFKMRGAPGSLCRLWTTIKANTPPSDQRDTALSQIQTMLDCSQ